MSTFKEHKVEILGAIGAILIIHAFLVASTYRGDHIDSTTAGQYGDFIGGYLGTIFLVVSVALLAASYKNQKATNEATLREQTATNKRTAFEARFFELLKFHRENVAEIGIGEKLGRRVFVSLIREFRGARRLVDEVLRDLQLVYPLRDRNDLAYTAIYYGVGPNSTRVLSAALSPQHPKELVDKLIGLMERAQSEYKRIEAQLNAPEGSISHVREYLMELRRDLSKQAGVSYCPYDGHQSRLGHYYRHLFQLIKYVKNHAPEGTAREYADLVRAQLTNHEQALLCLNAMAKIGSAWIALGYLIEFSLIQNIPESFFDPENELDLRKEFPTIRFEFMKFDGAMAEPNRSDN